MRRRFAVALAPFLAGTAVVLWFILSSSGGGGTSEPNGPAPRSTGAPSARALKPTAGSGKHAPKPRLKAEERTPIILRGKVVFDDKVSGATTTIRAHVQFHKRSVTCTLAKDDTFALDVSSLVSSPSRELLVTADHPECVPETGHATPKEGITLHLRRAAIAKGRVLGPDNSPAAGAAVACFGAREGKPEPSPSATGVTDAKGRYRLRLAGSGNCWVVAVSGRFVPASTTASLAVGATTSVADIVLHDGASISGRVLVNGGPAPAKTCLRAKCRGVDRLEWQGIGYAGHRFLRCNTWSYVTATGDFEIGGLDRRTYDVGFADIPGMCDDVCQSLAPHRAVFAPASGVDFALELSSVTLHTRYEGKIVPDLNVLVGTVHRVSYALTDKRGCLREVLFAGRPFGVEVGVRFGPPGIRKFVAPPAGEHEDIDLKLIPLKSKRSPPAVTLFVTLHAPPGVALPKEFDFSVTTPDGKEYPCQYGESPEKDGTYRVALQTASAGPAVLHIEPGGILKEPPKMICATTEEVALPQQGSIAVAADLEVGGLLRVAARSPSGAYLQAEATIRSPGGSPISVYYKCIKAESTSVGDDLSQGMNEVWPPLAPGTYELDLKMKGYHSVTRTVEIHAGKVTTTEVTLPPR